MGMKERRKRDGQNNVVFDYRNLVDKTQHKGEKLLKMKKGPISYVTDGNVRFYTDHPFQWVSADEADNLLGFPEEGYVYFVNATIADVEDEYAD